MGIIGGDMALRHRLGVRHAFRARLPGRCPVCDHPVKASDKVVGHGNAVAHEACATFDANRRSVQAGTTFAGTPVAYRRKPGRGDGRRF